MPQNALWISGSADLMTHQKSGPDPYTELCRHYTEFCDSWSQELWGIFLKLKPKATAEVEFLVEI